MRPDLFRLYQGWAFMTPNFDVWGPYSSPEMAEQKFQEYLAFEVFAPKCHHA